MCTTGTSTGMNPFTPLPVQPTIVAGADGTGSVATDTAQILSDLAQQIEALRQALQGASALPPAPPPPPTTRPATTGGGPTHTPEVLEPPIRHPRPATPAPAPTVTPPAALDPLPTGIPQELHAALDVLRRGPLGGAELERALKGGLKFAITEDTGFADYAAPTIRINPKTLDFANLPGALAHEIGHALVHQTGALPRLDNLPKKLGFFGNEIVAELVASAVAKDGKFLRGASSVTTEDGKLRSARGALDDILTSDFYLDYYKIDAAEITEADRASAARVILAEATKIITSLGGTVPPEYAG